MRKQEQRERPLLVTIVSLFLLLKLYYVPDMVVVVLKVDDFALISVQLINSGWMISLTWSMKYCKTLDPELVVLWLLGVRDPSKTGFHVPELFPASYTFANVTIRDTPCKLLV